jgi:hypothetical protein
MKKITEIFVVLENRPGVLGDLCGHLAEHRINIEAIGVFHDTAKLYVNELKRAQAILHKLDYQTELRDVIKIDLEDQPGSLAEVSACLGKNGVNIEYCYGSLTKKGKRASVILDVSDIKKAVKVLKKL